MPKFISDAEMAKMEAKQPRVISDAEMADLEAKSKPSRPMAALEGFGQAATAGYLPHLQAATAGLVPDPNAQVNADLEAQGFKIQEPENTYLSRRDENLKRHDQYAKEVPGAYYGGQVGGIIATAPMMAKGLAKIPFLNPLPKTLAEGKGLLPLAARAAQSAGGGAVMGAVQNPGDELGKIDPFQESQRLENAKTGALMGAAAQVGTEGLKKGVDLVRSIPGKIKAYGETKAFKSSGAMLKDFRKAAAKGRVEEIGKEMMDSGLVQPGMTYEDVAQKAAQIKSDTGTRIGQIYDSVAGRGQLQVDAKKLASELIDAVSDPKVRPKLNTEAYDAAMEKIIQSIAKDPAKLNDVRYLNDLIGEVDDMINFSKRANELPSVQQGYLKIRQKLRDGINTIVEGAGKISGDPNLGKELKALNRRYGIMTEIASISKDRVARENSNRFASLTDTIVGTGGAVAGAATGALMKGDFEGAAKGAAVGAGLGLLNKGARLYGNPILAQGAYKTGGLLQAIPNPVTAGLSKGAGLMAAQPARLGASAANLLQGERITGASRGLLNPEQPMLLERERKQDRKPAKGKK